MKGRVWRERLFPAFLAAALLANLVFALLCRERTARLVLLCNAGLWLLCSLLTFCSWRQRRRRYREMKQWLPEDADIEPQELTPDRFQRLISDYASRIYEMELLKNKAENAHLQSQINPHFLYNTLDAIRGHATADGAFEVAKMIEILSRMFRYSISEKSGLLTLEDELSNVEDFLSIQRYRFGDRFDVRYDIDTSDIQILYYRVPKLILQPLVENAIQHGLEDMPSGGLITIRAYHTDTRLYIAVEDNGKGAAVEEIQAVNRKLECCDTAVERPGKHGIALVNIQKRIRFQYGKEYGLRLLLGAGAGVCAELELPWEERA